MVLQGVFFNAMQMQAYPVRLPHHFLYDMQVIKTCLPGNRLPIDIMGRFFKVYTLH